MTNVRKIHVDWYGQQPPRFHGGPQLAYQGDHLSNMVVFDHAPELPNYYLLVEMKTDEAGPVVTLPEILLEGAYWVIPNYYTQICQKITYQVCCKTGTGDFEHHSAKFEGTILPVIKHDGEPIDQSPMFDPYIDILDKRVDELIVAAGDIQIDSELKSDSGNPVQNRVVKAAIDGLEDDVDAVNGRLDDVNSAIGYVVVDEVSPNIYNPETDTSGVQLANAGYTFANADYSTSDFIDITGVSNPSMAGEVDTGYQALKICYYDSQKTNIADSTQNKRIGYGEETPNNTLFSLVVPQNAKYIRFHYSHVSKIYVGASFDPYEYAPYGTETIVLPSNETKEARGAYTNLNDRLNAIENGVSTQIMTVEYWGDSLTQGNQDSTGKSRATYLSELLGEDWTIQKYGVGGEKSNAISARASGIFAVITPGVTIPADGSTVDLTGHLMDIYGNNIAWGSGIYSSAYSSWITVNPCKVDGVYCILQRTNASSPITIKRQTPGTAIVVTRPTYIAMNSETFEKNHVLLICMGQNEGFNRDADELISQIDGLITARKADRYIVFGMPHALYGYTWQAPINEKLKMHYGKNYYDIEEYMKTPIYNGDTIVSSYALKDAGLTPTENDLTAIGNNAYPPSIMFDGVHFNQYGYMVWANREYLIGKWLGYWD